MNTRTSILIDARADKSTPSGRLFFLDIGAGRVLSANPDGSDLKTLVDEGRRAAGRSGGRRRRRTHLLDQHGQF